MKVDRNLNTFTQAVLSDEIKPQYLSITEDLRIRLESIIEEYITACLNEDIESTSMTGTFYNIVNTVYFYKLSKQNYEYYKATMKNKV